MSYDAKFEAMSDELFVIVPAVVFSNFIVFELVMTYSLSVSVALIFGHWINPFIY